ncbi:MAG TPA: hypothetical protein VFA74_14130 [Terriglobales bacterium]|nr:hypothetical protein [Terriglobales bacterium]
MAGQVTPPVSVSAASPPSAANPIITSSGNKGIPDWLSPLLQGITLLTVLGGVFAAGAWKGEIDARLDDNVRAREEQRMELKELSQQITELSKSISYLQGSMQISKPIVQAAPRSQR